MTKKCGPRVCLFAVLLSLGMGAMAFGAPYHSADTSADFEVNLGELLRVIQLYNSSEFHCEEGTEDGFAPGDGDRACAPHDSDYDPQDWKILLTELLRVIQMYNARIYGLDPSSEDGYAPLFDPEDPSGSLEGESLLAETAVDALEGDVDPSAIDTLRGLLLAGETAFLGEQPCDAADAYDEALGMLATVEDGLGGGPQKGPKLLLPAVQKVREAAARISMLRFSVVISLPGGTACPGRERYGAEPGTEQKESDNQHFLGTATFGVGRPGIRIDALGDVYFQLNVPGLDRNVDDAGAPGIPAARKLVAVPPGASVRVTSTPVIGDTLRVLLDPAQAEPADQSVPEDGPGSLPPDDDLYADRPLAMDEQIYSTDAFWPPEVCTVSPLGVMRGLTLYQVEISSGQYNPVTQQLNLFSSVAFEVHFENGPGGFLFEGFENPFESSPDVFLGAVINEQTVPEFPGVPFPISPSNLGEEFMVLTHPDFRDAADMLAAWKNLKGIMTNVYECGTGSGIAGRQTATEINAFIDNHYGISIIKPTYILLLGDAEFIAPFLLGRANTDFGDTIGSDWPYAITTYPGQEFPSLVPTFALGRIPVDTLQQATDVVNKIIDYEQTPPGSIGSDLFYKRIMIAAQFQCCRTGIAQDGVAQRTFTEVSEFVRAPLVSLGYQVDRIYTETVDNGCASCDPPTPPYTGDPTPRRYYDGTPLPAEIGPGSGFSWNGDTTDIINAWNQGRFLVFHRDHGWRGGWGDPEFDWDNFGSLTNGGFQPVVFSINCTSGIFDNETFPAEGTTPANSYFAERLLRDPVNGAVGLIGDTRVSPSTTNSLLARGLFDAIWPSVLPDFGNNKSKRRLGDILNHAKLYLVSRIGLDTDGTSYANAYDELLLYHVIGDPTLEIWTSDPNVITLPGDFVLGTVGLDDLVIQYAVEGAVITAYQDTPNGPYPVGRAPVVGGTATIGFFQAPALGENLLLSAQTGDSVVKSGSVQLPVAQ